MRKRQVVFPLVAALSTFLAGCDAFSVLDQFANGSPLTLTLQKVSVQQGESIALYPRGGVAPYSFGLVAGSLYHAGTTLGSIANDTYTAGDAIGTVMIHLSDSDGNSVDAVVTIIPPTPGGFTAAPNTLTPANTDILLSWSYVDTSLISGFQIQRSLDGVTFTNLPIQPSSATSYVDGSRSPGTVYYYRVYAVAGTYLSLPTGVQGSTSN